MRNSLSKKEREQAVVNAFQSVSRKFTWDKTNSRWIAAKVAKESISPFDQQQQQFPVSHPYDLQILSRMLVEIANADGRISREEGEWLMGMLDPNHGSIDTILSRPRLTPAELQQTSNGAVTSNTAKNNAKIVEMACKSLENLTTIVRFWMGALLRIVLKF